MNGSLMPQYHQKSLLRRLMRPIVLLTACVLSVCAAAQDKANQDKVIIKADKEKELSVERLPDLNIPRSTHSTLVINGEYVTFGGHTTGFIPTPTAEYYRDGAWHVMKMTYSHDGGLVLPLKSGKVLLAGGFEKHLGIGQTFVVEYYDPATHSFQGFGCMDQKRALSSGVELNNGQVIISGNWFEKDYIEVFDGRNTFSYVKKTSKERARPYMLRISRDNILIFNNLTNRDQYLEESVVIDQLQGEPFRVPLFNEWTPLCLCEQESNIEHWFIGDEEKELYAYLIPVRKTTGEMGLVHIQDTTFTMVPLQTPIPTHAMKSGQEIKYHSPLVIDRSIQRAYLIGLADNRIYCISIDYAKRPATVDVGYTDSIPAHCSTLTLTPNGDILVLGGVQSDRYNFSPLTLARLIKVGRPEEPRLQGAAARPWFWKALLLLAVVVVICAILLAVKKRRDSKVEQPLSSETSSVEEAAEVKDASSRHRVVPDEELIASICQVMEEQQAYLNSGLKLADISAMVHTNSRYVSDCIKRSRGCSFTQFVNAYRIEHAKRMLLSDNEAKIAVVAIQSGFANETSFFRTFKSLTGLTPREWLVAHHNRARA